MKIKGTFTFLAVAVMLCAAAGDLFGQGRGRRGERPSNVRPVISTTSGYISQQRSRRYYRRGYMGRDNRWWTQSRHRGWRNKKYTYGYRNYGQYRRTQVGNRRNRSFIRPSWADTMRRRRARY